MNQSAQRTEFEYAGAPGYEDGPWAEGWDDRTAGEGIDWGQEADGFAAAPDTSALSDIAQMAQRLIALDADIAQAEESLQRLKRARAAIAEGDLPTAMEGAGLQALTLDNGAKLSVKETLYAEMPKAPAKRAEAAAWMVEHGHASLVKTDVTVQFDRGDGDMAKDTASLLRARGLTPVMSENMNTASVKAAIKALMAQGVDVPLSTFGAYLKKEAVVK